MRLFTSLFLRAALLLTIIVAPGWRSLAGERGPSAARNPAMSFTVSSPSFPNGGKIEKKFTCDGADVSPQIAWANPPSDTKSFALLTDDPDAPAGNWNHWVMWNIPPSVTSLPEGLAKHGSLPDGSEQGMNDFHKTGYNGPCPPPGKPHRYFFKLYALSTTLTLKSGATKRDLEAAMKDHMLAQSEYMGRYGR